MKIIGLSIQTGLFTTGFIISDKLDIASKLTKETGTLFDGDPILIPLPPEAPQEFPRLILKNKDERYSFQATTTRLDLFFKNEKSSTLEEKEVGSLIKKYVSDLKIVVSAVNKILQPKIIRLGFVLNLQFQVDDAINIIKSSYIKDLKFTKDTHDLNAGFLNQDKINKINSNIWFRVNAFRLDKHPKDNKVLLVSFDINTVPEESQDLKIDDIMKYVELALKYVDDNLKVFVPQYNESIDG